MECEQCPGQIHPTSAGWAHGWRWLHSRPALVSDSAASSPGRADAAPTTDPVLGAGKVQADFNGDGFGDLAVLASTTYDEDQDRRPFGSVTVLYGSARGLSTTGRQRIVGGDFARRGDAAVPVQPRCAGGRRFQWGRGQ